MLSTILKLLGFGNGGSVGNTVLGVANYATLASLGTWAWLHRDEQITFSISLGGLCLVIGAAWLLLELNRRAPYGQHNGGTHE